MWTLSCSKTNKFVEPLCWGSPAPASAQSGPQSWIDGRIFVHLFLPDHFHLAPLSSRDGLPNWLCNNIYKTPQHGLFWWWVLRLQAGFHYTLICIICFIVLNQSHNLIIWSLLYTLKTFIHHEKRFRIWNTRSVLGLGSFANWLLIVLYFLQNCS